MKTYDSYKNSGIEWIREIPSTWKVSRFNHNFSFSRGLPITKQDLKNSGIPCVSYGEIHSKFGRIVDPEKHELKFADESFLISNPKSLLTRGDFLFADTSEDVEGSGNFTCLDSDVPTFAGYHTVIARLLNRNDFDYKYLSYFLDSIEFRNQIRSSVSGIKVFSITQGILKDTSVVIPPHNEQVAIASYLDRKTAEIDELIADKKRLLELYEEEKTAVVNQAVTKGLDPNAPMKDSGIEWLGEIPEHWQVPNLKYVCDFILDGTHGSFPRVEHGYRLLSVRNIINDEFVFRDDDSKVSEKHFQEISKRFLIRKGDVQLAIVGATLGKVAVVRDMSEPFVTQRSVATIRTNTKCLPEFLFYFIKTSNFQSFLWLNTGFSAQPGIYLGTIQNSVIPLPSIQEQLQIVSFVEKQKALIDDKVTKTQKLIELLSEYRTALISEVVTGKVKVTD